jgi:hypothetical protein
MRLNKEVWSLATATPTIGGELADQLFAAIREANRVPLEGARDLPVLTGLVPDRRFKSPQENVLAEAAQILVKSGGVFAFGNAYVLADLRMDGLGLGLVPLRTESRVEVGAASFLSNLMACQEGDSPFPVPPWFADLLLRYSPLNGRLPRIRHYATRPVFDDEFVLRSQGWHPDVGILVHGPMVDPRKHSPRRTSGPAIDRLPPHLRALLCEFCFKCDADLVNLVGLLLTGILMNHFTVNGKAIGLIDGNQPTLGKTLLALSVGQILDGFVPQLTHFTEDNDEMLKRFGASLRERFRSVLLIDNAKLRGGSEIQSASLEALCSAPEVSGRILGRSENFTRPNDVLWLITMNATKASGDLVARGVPVQLAFEGSPEERTFTGDPLRYAREHRIQLLGELLGMVDRWNQQGRPRGRHRNHRFAPWAQTIGDILDAVGLVEFLDNAQAAAASFNTELDKLSALAEVVISSGGPFIELPPTGERRS